MWKAEMSKIKLAFSYLSNSFNPYFSSGITIDAMSTKQGILITVYS